MIKPSVDGLVAVSFACGAAVAVLVGYIIAVNGAMLSVLGGFAAAVAGATLVGIAWLVSGIDAWVDAHMPEEEDSYE